MFTRGWKGKTGKDSGRPYLLLKRHQPSHVQSTQTTSTVCAQSHTNQITIYAQSTQTRSTIPGAIHPNETVGAAPVCLPERSRSGVSIPKIGLCITHGAQGIERWMRPCGATRAGTQAPPLPISIKHCGVPLPHHIVHSIAHANRTVCPYLTVLHIR